MQLSRKNHAEQHALLMDIFYTLRQLLVPYAKYFSVRIDIAGRYELWSEKRIVIAGRERKEVFFASIIVQSTYVGFYFMPLYTEEGLTKVFGKDLLKLRKGKSCFHIKRTEDALFSQVEKALAEGFTLYKQRKWVETE